MPSSGKVRLLRIGLISLCLLLSFTALRRLADLRAHQAELVGLLKEVDSEVRHPDAIRRVSFERTAHHAQLAVARVLVYDVLTGNATATSIHRLPAARDLAQRVLRKQPNSWQASMLLGAATYLEWSLEADRRLFTDAPRWEAPLIRAMSGAEAKPEARRFLVSAYLETWQALSPEKRAFAQELLKTTLREDPDVFRRLAPLWLEVAEDRATGLAVIPDRPEAWQHLSRAYAKQKNWEAYCETHARSLASLEKELNETLDEAEVRLRLGDLHKCREMCLGVIVSAPRDGRFAHLVTRALEIYPPGLHGFGSRDSLKEWLQWALELNTISIDPFEPHIVNRLLDAVGEIEPPVGALAALIGNDPYHTGRYEKLSPTRDSKAWIPHLIAKTRWLVERGQLTRAEEAFAEIHREGRQTAPYWLTKQRLARAAQDLVGLGTAERRLAEIRAQEWQALDWRLRGSALTLELYPESAADGLVIDIGQAPPEGAVVQILWDGTTIAVLPAAARESLELRLDIDPSPHLLELRALAGGEVYPALTRLTGLLSSGVGL